MIIATGPAHTHTDRQHSEDGTETRDGGEEERTVFVERSAAEQQLVGDHPEAEEVRLRAVHVVLREHLRRQVLLGPARQAAHERLAARGKGLHVGHSEAADKEETDKQTNRFIGE